MRPGSFSSPSDVEPAEGEPPCDFCSYGNFGGPRFLAVARATFIHPTGVRERVNLCVIHIEEADRERSDSEDEVGDEAC